MRLPLLFRFSFLVEGNGFLARIRTEGRVLLDEDGSESWMYGVQPGGIAGGGTDRRAAFRDFEANYLSVLFDLAAYSGSFDDFQRETQKFFDEIHDACASDWQEALQMVRAQSHTEEGLRSVSADEVEPYVEVVKLEMSGFSSDMNTLPELVLARAA